MFCNSFLSILTIICGYFFFNNFFSAMGDFHELKLEFRRVWSPVQLRSNNNNNGSNSNSDNPLPMPPGSFSSRTVQRSSSFGTPGVRSSGNFGTVNLFSSSGGGGGAGSVAGTPNRGGGPSFSSALASPASTGFAAVNSAELGSAGVSPGVRFCHVGVIYDSALYIFGGYDGTQRYCLKLFVTAI